MHTQLRAVVLMTAAFLIGSCSGKAISLSDIGGEAALASPPAERPLATQAKPQMEQPPAEQALSQPPVDQALPASPSGQSQPQTLPISQDLLRTDNQGAVQVAVLPLNLGVADADVLDFEIAMNTHSVDLSMDLAGLASLENDRGVLVPAEAWTGGNGHHVSGVLSFPLRDAQGLSVLEGAALLVLRIESVDAALREFRWEIGPSQ